MEKQPTPKRSYGNQVRIILYAPVQLKNDLKRTLFLQDTTMSEWFRQKATEEIDNAKTER